MTNRSERLWHFETMKMKWSILALLLALPAIASAQTNNLTSLLQQGLLEEQGNRNLDAAIADYQSLAALFDKDRQLAATAVFRLGECYRAQGKTNEAVAQYQRIIREFPDQNTLAIMSRQNLVGLGATAAAAAPAASENGDAKLYAMLEHLPRPELERILPTLLPDAVLTKLLEQRNEADVKLADLATVDASTHPAVKGQKAIIDLLDHQITEKITGIMAALKLRAELAKPSASPMAANGVLSNEVAADEDQEIQRIQQMIQNSPDLINATQVPPLVLAADSGHLRVAQYLLDAHANVNVKKDETGESPLTAAAEHGNKAMVELLLAHGADINAPGNQGETALSRAALKGFQAVTEALLAHKPDVNWKDRSGYTALHSAGQYAKITQMLLAAGADPNSRANDGDMPLMSAVTAGSPETVRELLAAGADPNGENSKGFTALSMAVGQGSPEIEKILLAAKADPDGGKMKPPLLLAVYRQDTNSAELLLNAGANANNAGVLAQSLVQSEPGLILKHLTPLWLAIHKGPAPMVRLLLRFKADPNDSQMEDPPMFSALSNPEMVQALLDAGAKIDAREKGASLHRTLLQDAVMLDCLPSAELLLKGGADVNARDEFGNTSLIWAALAGKWDRKLFELLLDHHADPNAQNNKGDTPLQIARQFTKGAEIASLLRDHGALDNPPRWDRIEVNHLSAQFPQTIFTKRTNDWNHFTLLEMILNYYVDGTGIGIKWGPPTVQFSVPQFRDLSMPFPDLTRVAVVRPNHGPANEPSGQTRTTVNLLDSTNAIDCSKDVPLEFGDMVEIPQREHSLGDQPVKLTSAQFDSIINCLKGTVQLVVHDQKTELLLEPVADKFFIGHVLALPEAQKLILSSSDLTRVKVTRHDPKTGENHEWILDCSNPKSVPDLRLRDGDVIEIPEKS
jgi:ankyrin repeat protein